MEKIWALVKDGVVRNTIVAEQPFIDHLLISGAWDDRIRIDTLEIKPGIGWAYTDGEFVAPEIAPE